MIGLIILEKVSATASCDAFRSCQTHTSCEPPEKANTPNPGHSIQRIFSLENARANTEPEASHNSLTLRPIRGGSPPARDKVSMRRGCLTCLEDSWLPFFVPIKEFGHCFIARVSSHDLPKSTVRAPWPSTPSMRQAAGHSVLYASTPTTKYCLLAPFGVRRD